MSAAMDRELASGRNAARARLLRLFLALGALTWGVAGVGVFIPWDQAAGLLQDLGARAVEYDPMLDYWLRMAAGAFALMGGLFAMAAFRPMRFEPVLPWFAGMMLVEGAILGVHGWRLGLPPFPFYGDVAACVASGVGILGCRARWGARR